MDLACTRLYQSAVPLLRPASTDPFYGEYLAVHIAVNNSWVALSKQISDLISHDFHRAPSKPVFPLGPGRRLSLRLIWGIMPACYGGVIWAVHNASTSAASESTMMASLGRVPKGVVVDDEFVRH